MPKFTQEERELLEKYVTSAEAGVFAVRGLAGIVGAIYARYSRAPGGFRETLLKEFIKEGNLDAARAQDLIERVLIAFGDDSVGELEGAHVSFEGISILATKELEDRRIGGSPIEQSTRYVFYDRRGDDGEFLYVRPEEIMSSPHADAYVETMDFIFGTYCDLVEPMQEFYRARRPIESVAYDIDGDGEKERFADLTDEKDVKAFKRTYKADIRTKACDSLRALLPVATKTNVGMFANGRFYQGLISHCLTTDIPEVTRIAHATKAALDQVIPRYVKRAQRKEYEVKVRGAMRELADELFAGIAPAVAEKDVDLMDRGEDAIATALAGGAPTADAVRAAFQDEQDVLMVASMLFPYLAHPLRQIRAEVRKMPAEVRDRIIAAYTGDRITRRDRPGRAFESGYTYTFDMVTDFGTYKDLERHRMTTQLRQKFSPLLGFNMPKDLEVAGFADRAKECHDMAASLYDRLLPDLPEQASYATLHGSKVRWSIGLNDREAHHLIELRTTPQGHPSYRRVAQKMHMAIAERSSWRGAVMRFADHNDYASARGDAEAKQRVKERALDEKTPAR